MIDTKEVRTIEMMERIENYILGRLSQEEIDQLWMEFLKAPECLGYLEIEVGEKNYIRKELTLWHVPVQKKVDFRFFYFSRPCRTRGCGEYF